MTLDLYTQYLIFFFYAMDSTNCQISLPDYKIIPHSSEFGT